MVDLINDGLAEVWPGDGRIAVLVDKHDVIADAVVPGMCSGCVLPFEAEVWG